MQISAMNVGEPPAGLAEFWTDSGGSMWGKRIGALDARWCKLFELVYRCTDGSAVCVYGDVQAFIPRDTQAKAKGHESSSDHNHEWIIARCGAQYAVCSGATLVR